MKLCIVVGTRPEIIKMSPVVRACQEQGVDFFILHTGQHYSYNLDGLFFEELELPPPKYNLAVGSGTFAIQLGKMLVGIENVLLSEKPDWVIAEGDTNTVLAAVLSATSLHIPFAHVEAGLRSYNFAMQEEKNRIMADSVSQLLFPPTGHALSILEREGKDGGKAFVSGNTVVDAVNHYLPLAERKVSLPAFGIEPKKYFLVTIHRAENTDSRDVLSELLNALEAVYKDYKLPLLFPIHPRTKARIDSYGLRVPVGVRFMEPVGFFEFLVLEKNARLILTDSGGVQEESCIMRVPCVTLRKDTERPETVQVGGNVLTDLSVEDITLKVGQMLNRPASWVNPFGDGRAGRIILDCILRVRK